jgi:hypothetical protein
MQTLLSFQPHLLTVHEGIHCVFQGYLPREFVTPSVLKDQWPSVLHILTPK